MMPGIMIMMIVYMVVIIYEISYMFIITIRVTPMIPIIMDITPIQGHPQPSHDGYGLVLKSASIAARRKAIGARQKGQQWPHAGAPLARLRMDKPGSRASDLGRTPPT
jgi:hypothetical protein